MSEKGEKNVNALKNRKKRQQIGSIPHNLNPSISYAQFKGGVGTITIIIIVVINHYQLAFLTLRSTFPFSRHVSNSW